jgi:GTP-binding protein YchF
MSVGIGIIGLAKSGRTTIFNALTKGKATTGSHTPEVPHIGAASIADSRLKMLATLLKPKRVVPAEVKYLDIGASVKSLAKDTALSGQYLSQLSNVDALIDVARAFANENIPHTEGSIDAARDIARIDLELIFSDLAIIERRLKRMELSLKGASQAERQGLLHEQGLLTKVQTELEKDVPIRELSLSAEQSRTIAGYQFLSAKPLLTVVNIGEDQLEQAKTLEGKLNLRSTQVRYRLITLCGKLEMELAELDNSTAEGFRAEFGLSEPGLERAIKLSFELLGLISFFTTASGEVRAWSIKSGTPAVRAAGKIHSDMERGFIRAEVVSLDDLLKCGSLAEAKKHGLLRLEGKRYIVQDGDVITFLFNV